MSANLHISHTNIANESRLLRETHSIISHQIASHAFIVGKLDGDLPERETIDGQREIWRIKLKTRNLPKSLLFQVVKYIEFTIAILSEYKNKNIAFVNCHSLIVLPIGILLKFLYKTKVIYDTHELETETYGLKGLRKWLSELAEKYLIQFVDHTFVVGNYIADEYAKRYHIKKPDVVLNCPNYARINPSDYFRKKFSIEEDVKIFLYQGVLSEGRGISLLLDTFSNLKAPKDNVVIFLGYGPLESSILESSRQNENIYFHEAVPPDVLLQYTAAADIGLSLIEGDCLSYRYCLPNKLFEYIMAGLPVIVSDLPEMKCMVENNEVGYVLIQNTSGGLIQLIENITTEKLYRYRENAKKAAKIYSWQEQEKKMINVYSELIT